MMEHLLAYEFSRFLAQNYAGR